MTWLGSMGASCEVTGELLGSTFASSPLAQPSSTSVASATDGSVVSTDSDRLSADSVAGPRSTPSATRVGASSTMGSGSSRVRVTS